MILAQYSEMRSMSSFFPPVLRADQPGRYGYGPNMPRGSIDVVRLTSGGFTVARVIHGVMWFPLDERDNPKWLTWDSAIKAAAWVYTVKPVYDWPHWGTAPAGVRPGQCQ
ncbi:hypothetical protein [Azohydromonas aeria]|uniref:hypothetical protein n=1 Tax=Azohydromonas aeria TaxID=2590212 RepID=UPI0012F875F2|nr:hypothetical protein [Azohydromonas aeria]